MAIQPIIGDYTKNQGNTGNLLRSIKQSPLKLGTKLEGRIVSLDAKSQIIINAYVMGNLFILLLLMSFFAGNPPDVFAQKDVIASAETAIRTGKAKDLAQFFNESVELNFIDQKKNYSRTQAEFVLKGFFEKYPALDFHYVHKTTSQGGFEFTIGTYTHSGGRFRVNMLIKQANGRYLIDMLDFEQE
jgi:hypothetical protein